LRPRHNFPGTNFSSEQVEALREKISELKRKRNFAITDPPGMNIRVCPATNFSDASAIGCHYCGKKLGCVGCSDKVGCLGRDEIHFCSHRCTEEWEKVLMNQIKLRHYMWKHPFKAMAMAGCFLTLSCSFIIAFQTLKLIAAVAVSGLLIMATAGVLYLIHESGKS
jgi:hypothetical protein